MLCHKFFSFICNWWLEKVEGTYNNEEDNLLMIVNVLHILSVTRWEVESLVSERKDFLQTGCSMSSSSMSTLFGWWINDNTPWVQLIQQNSLFSCITAHKMNCIFVSKDLSNSEKLAFELQWPLQSLQFLLELKWMATDNRYYSSWKITH
jgi:hypothetical protein